MAINTGDQLMDELYRALLDVKVLVARLDRIQVAEVMEEDYSEVALRTKLTELVQAVADLTTHDMLGGFENVAQMVRSQMGEGGG